MSYLQLQGFLSGFLAMRQMLSKNRVAKKLGKWTLFVAVGFPLGYIGGIQERDSNGNNVQMNTGMVQFGCTRISE